MTTTYKKVGEVTALYYYPVKSCSHVNVTEGHCHELGMEFDRRWAVVDRGGKVIGLSSRPELSLVKPTLTKDSLKLDAPGMETFYLPLDVLENGSKDEGGYVEVCIRGIKGSGLRVSEEADEWFSKYLGRQHTLIVFTSNCRPRFLHTHPRFGKLPLIKESDKVAFAGDTPFLLISEESVKVLDEKCAKFKSDVLRFRPNIVINGADAFAEDSWSHVRIGDVEFRCLKKCGRCPVPNIDPFSGVKDKEEPLKTLKEFRQVSQDETIIYGQSPIMGRNLGTEDHGVIKVGDVVYAM